MLTFWWNHLERYNLSLYINHIIWIKLVQIRLVTWRDQAVFLDQSTLIYPEWGPAVFSLEMEMLIMYTINVCFENYTFEIFSIFQEQRVQSWPHCNWCFMLFNTRSRSAKVKTSRNSIRQKLQYMYLLGYMNVLKSFQWTCNGLVKWFINDFLSLTILPNCPGICLFILIIEWGNRACCIWKQEENRYLGVGVAICCVWTHWGWVAHVFVGKITIIGSDNGLSPGRRQAIIWTNAGILLIWTLRNKPQWNFNQTFSIKKMHLKMSSILPWSNCVKSHVNYFLPICLFCVFIKVLFAVIFMVLFSFTSTHQPYISYNLSAKWNPKCPGISARPARNVSAIVKTGYVVRRTSGTPNTLSLDLTKINCLYNSLFMIIHRFIKAPH